jgi:hypothetical protein
MSEETAELVELLVTALGIISANALTLRNLEMNIMAQAIERDAKKIQDKLSEILEIEAKEVDATALPLEI